MPVPDRTGILRRVAGNTGAQAIAELLGRFAILGTYAVVARSLGTIPLGQLTFAISLGIVVQFAGLGMDPLVTREVARDRRAVDDVLWNVVGLKLIIGGAATLAVIAIALLGDFDPDLRVMLIVITVSGLVDLVAATPAWVLRGVEAMVPAANSQLAQRLSLSAIAIGAVLVFDGGIIAVSLAYFFGALVGAGMLVRELTRRHLWPSFSFSFARAKAIAFESLPLGASAALSTALARLDAILLAGLATLSVVGIYGAAYRLMESTFFIGWAFGIALFPMLSRLGPETQPTLGRVFAIGTRISLAGLMPVGAILILFPAPLIELIYGPAFSAAVGPTRWLGIVAGVNGLAALALFALAARNLRGAILKVCLLALVVNVALNLALIPTHGATGAAIAMAAANVALAVVGTWLASREIGPVSAVRMIVLTVIAFGAMALTRFLFGETWIGLAAGLLAYGAALLPGHHWLFGGDTKLVRTLIANRGTGTPAGADG